MNEVINHFKNPDPKNSLNELWVKYIILSEKLKSVK